VHNRPDANIGTAGGANTARIKGALYLRSLNNC
jgi:hypothetical protein